jgi:hypothetical protein
MFTTRRVFLRSGPNFGTKSLSPDPPSRAAPGNRATLMATRRASSFVCLRRSNFGATEESFAVPCTTAVPA